MAAKDVILRRFRDGIPSPAALRSHHSAQSTTRRPSRVRGELLSIGLGDGGVGLGVSLLPSMGFTATVNFGGLLQGTQPPHHPHTSLASFSDPGPSISVSSTATIVSETPGPTQPGSPTQPSTTPPPTPPPPFPSPYPTGQTADPGPQTTSSSSSQTAKTLSPIAGVAPIRNELSYAVSATPDDGGANTPSPVTPGSLSPTTARATSTAITVFISEPQPSQTPPGEVVYYPPPSRSLSASPSGSPLYNPSNPHRRLSTGAIVGIALGASAVIVCAALALFFLLRRRRARRKSKRMSVESARRLEPYSYDDDSSRPVSSVWTAFGSVSVYPDLEPEHEPRREPSTSSLDFRFSEKESGIYSPCPSPSPGPEETQPLARGLSLSSVHSLHDGLSAPHTLSASHLNVPPPSPFAPSFRAASPSELLALAGTDYAFANPSNPADGGLGRSVSGVSRVTAASGEVQSVEAL